MENIPLEMGCFHQGPAGVWEPPLPNSPLVHLLKPLGEEWKDADPITASASELIWPWEPHSECWGIGLNPRVKRKLGKLSTPELYDQTSNLPSATALGSQASSKDST